MTKSSASCIEYVFQNTTNTRLNTGNINIDDNLGSGFVSGSIQRLIGLCGWNVIQPQSIEEAHTIIEKNLGNDDANPHNFE